MATDDDEMTFSNVLHGASSCQEDNDENSVDIYDDLDSTPIAPSNSSTKVIPDGNNLNLFDEILIEEGTAKQASYNVLQAEYEKCQQQLQELMKRFQEIQKQNAALQNENQSLKRNISALIKTARVEINRKDAEISALQRRLPQTPVHHNISTRTYFPAPTYHAKKDGASKSKSEPRDLLPENNQEMDIRTKQALPKDIPQGYTSREVENKKRHSEKGAAPYIPPSDPEELYSNDAHSNLANVDKEEKKDMHHSKEKEHKYKTKAQQYPESTSDGLLNAHEKLHVNSEKTVRNGFWKDKGLNIKCSPNAEKQTDIIPSTREKLSTPTDRLLPKTGHCNNDGAKKANINQKDFDTRSKEERIRQPDRHLEPQGSAAFAERNAIAKSSQKSSKSCVEERKITVNNCGRNKGRSNHGTHGGFSDPALPVFNREPRHGHLKEENSKYEHMHSKPDTHRTEEKRKSGRDNPRESRSSSQNERRGSKEILQKTARRATKKEDNSEKEEEKFLRSEETDKSVGDMEEPMSTKAGRAEEQTKSKDLKLSFMQTLNLTLSPAKKQTDNSITKVCDIDIPSQKVLLASREERKKNEVQLCTSFVPLEPITTKQTKIPLLPCHDNPVQTNKEEIISISEVKMQVKNEEALNREPSKMPPSPQNTEGQYEMVPNTKTEREESPMDPDSPFNDLETISSVDFDSLSVIDEIHGSDSDSSMEEGESGSSKKNKILVSPEKESKPVLCTHTADKGKITNDGVPIVNHNLKPNSPEDGSFLESLRHPELNPTPQPRDTNPVSVDDDNSILSIDLNQMRGIPKAISPLNSPIRPLAKALRMESPYKGPVKSHNADFVPEGAAVYSGRNQSSELNKENEKPLGTDHQVLEVSQLNMSSEELEEGEIVSDGDEPKIGQSSENSKKSKRKTSPDRSHMSKNTCNHKVKSTPSSEDDGKLGPGKKGKGKTHDETLMSSKEMKKNKAVSIDYLERIVQITVKPATVHEFMHMLRAIRKQMRKNYMKFKIQFPVQHFYRIIDSAVVNFTSLVKYLDFSKMAKSSEALKLDLCEVIESKLNQIKKNSAIEHLFKQQQSDMKKKLWKLVEEQLDYLFDKIKKMLLKLCNLVNFGNESNETKLDKRTKENPKCLPSHKSERKKSKKNTRTRKHNDCVLPKPGNQQSKGSYLETNKMDTHKNTATKCKRSSPDNAKHSQTELFKEKSKQDTTLKVGKYEKEEPHTVGDPHKSDVSCGPLTEQQMSGLTFNLVNDAQMGEMFKSLLQGSTDLSEKNVDFTDENQWEFRTPEKHTIEGGHNGEDELAYEAEESIQKEIPLESKVLDGIKWPTVSSERDSSFLARMQMPIDPAILDESCMFEIPNSPVLKKGEACTSDKPKSLVSSILLEDLAVSLTIPSPLKSDAHLSFLKPEVLGSVPEDVLNAHLNEDAHLDEEDASEQDIHLALESDNSSGKSSCSSSWVGLPPASGFQYCPSLPMQAVIMEKSNDHFIVKIRRAAPSSSPVLDQVRLVNEPLTCHIEGGKYEITPEEKVGTLNFKSITLEDAAASTDNATIRGNTPVGKEQVPNSQGCMKEVSKCLERVQKPAQSETQQNINLHASDDSPKESLFSNVRQKQPCGMPEFLQEPCTNICSNLGPDLPGSYPGLGSHVGSKEASGLQDPSKERKEPFVSLKESSSKTIQQEDSSDVFKLPQTQTLTFSPKSDVQYTKEQCSLVNSESIALVEDLSSRRHFGRCADVKEETPMENEADSWNLTVESALNARTESSYKDKVEQKMNRKDHCEAGRSSEIAIEAVTNLTEELLDKSVVNVNLETKSALSSHDQGHQMSKVSKKRKKEAEVATSTKRYRKESNDLTCKKNGKSQKKSKETNSVSPSTSSKKNTSTSDKDSFLSTLSVSPSSLRAKNIVKRKGEVLISWTRNDDREILLECQKKGPSGKTFASVAARLNKSPTQVEERFKQLVKLFEMSNYS
ncbi:CASP8-associated protein 2 [Anolis carolinensis]|uniref:CASP8-associated protein 2 n=1 Tax=Anolis carolinensis TaxID=28377 RepID=G1KPT9_ANOCA|nr:PREDICTED: CASP8-associated protein 2 [Anolis carolinensis]|eukprot:XP_008117621.1 PREDICTED: CASP8-associated protein 2 [Anolis carolinensis]